jgi:hypothetical protein
MTFGREHLARPESFPKAAEGVPWGGESVTLSIAGTSYRFEGLDARRAAMARRRWEGWTCEAGGGARTVTTRVCRADDAGFRPFPGAGEEIRADVDFGARALRLCGPLWLARLELEPELSGALFLPSDGADEGEGALENYLRFASGYALLAEGGVVVHSAAVVESGAAHLFPAASGSGKSTLSRISLGEGRTVLSDDMNALVRRGGRTWVEQVPFTGDLGRARVPGGPFPLASICRLRKGDSVGVAPLGHAEALGLLFAETPPLNRDAARQERLWDVLEELVDGAALRTVTFPKGGPVWSALGKEMAHDRE